MKNNSEADQKYTSRYNFHEEEWHTTRGRAIREVVFGVNDGLITTLGFLAGVSGSIAQRDIILIATLAEIVASAFSMASGAYISSKSQREFFQKEIEREKREIEEDPEHEIEEIRQIYAERGFTSEEISILVRRITSSKDLWLRFMLKEELGLGDEAFENPVKIGLTMGASFLVGSVVPLIPFLLFTNAALLYAVIASFLFLFALGAFKTKITHGAWIRSGLEMLAIGMASATVGYVTGIFVSRLIGH